ncbi:MAG: hypothetical protein JJD92_06810 [Frankiaceae bacterium]|nr:hypothetical protein [Frankiaceae bacterium]
MRRVSGDSGAVAVLVALLLPVVLLGFGALVLDVGSLYAERRQLQNGADAAALAIAANCSQGSCTDAVTGLPEATAQTYGNTNDNRGSVNVERVCGVGSGLTACPVGEAAPSGLGYVRVRVRTGTSGGPGLMPPLLGRALDPTYDGTNVRAVSTVAWGVPITVASGLPLTISQCEVPEVNTLPSFTSADAVSIASLADATEAILYLHDTTGASDCPAGPSGADLPGGFGWLDATAGCTALTDDGVWYDDKTGVPPPTVCDPADFDALVGTVVYIPVFEDTNQLNGSNGSYRMASAAAFFLTGYSIVGQYTHKSIASLTYPCSGQATCISGFFVNVPYSDAIGELSDDASNGVVSVKIVD